MATMFYIEGDVKLRDDETHAMVERSFIGAYLKARDDSHLVEYDAKTRILHFDGFYRHMGYWAGRTLHIINRQTHGGVTGTLKIWTEGFMKDAPDTFKTDHNGTYVNGKRVTLALDPAVLHLDPDPLPPYPFESAGVYFSDDPANVDASDLIRI